MVTPREKAGRSATFLLQFLRGYHQMGKCLSLLDVFVFFFLKNAFVQFSQVFKEKKVLLCIQESTFKERSN